MFNIDYLRSFRILDYAWFDLILSFAGLALLSPLLSWLFRKIHLNIPKRNWIILMLPLSIVIHLAAGQNTALTQHVLFENGYWLEKIVIIVCLITGFSGIKITTDNKK